METHSSILAWEFPWAEEPGGLQSMGSQSQTWLKTTTQYIYSSVKLYSFYLVKLYFYLNSQSIYFSVIGAINIF